MAFVTDPKDISFEAKIGEGFFGIVHLATWKGKKVAVKTIKSDHTSSTEPVMEEITRNR